MLESGVVRVRADGKWREVEKWRWQWREGEGMSEMSV